VCAAAALHTPHVEQAEDMEMKNTRGFLALIGCAVALVPLMGAIYSAGLKTTTTCCDPNDPNCDPKDPNKICPPPIFPCKSGCQIRIVDVIGGNLNPGDFLFAASLSIVSQPTALVTVVNPTAPEPPLPVLHPPIAPITPKDEFSTFVSSAKEFPNLKEGGSGLTVKFLGKPPIATDHQVEASWEGPAQQGIDGPIPDVVLMRLAVMHPGDRVLTLDPVGPLALTITGVVSVPSDPGHTVEIPIYVQFLDGSLVLEQELPLNLPGTPHHLTATARHPDDSPVVGVPVTFDVLSGPNAGKTGVSITGADGVAHFSYVGEPAPAGIGVDVIVASYVDPRTGSTIESGQLLKFWDFDCNDNAVPDTCDLDCAGFGGECSAFASCGRSADAGGNGVPDECPGLPRAGASSRGSVLIFPKVEVRWSAAGDLVQDTFIQISNDLNTVPVRLVSHFISEDCQKLPAEFELTKNQPTWFAASTGLPLGVAPVKALSGALKTDPVTGERFIRGYFLCFAVNDAGQQIRFNFLTGLASVVRYDQADAYEYSSYGFQALLGTTGSPVGTPGVLRMDGVEYESGFNRLLLEFMASGSGAFSGGGRTITHDTLVSLLIHNIDVRQEKQNRCTKAYYLIYNANELSFDEEYCFCCWDCRRLGDVGGLFLVENLHTDRGRAVIEGLASPTVCDVFDPLHPFKPKSTEEPLLGVEVKELLATGSGLVTRAASHLVGTGNQTATILFDVPGPPQEKGRGRR
jgi:hypothetical protein